MRAREFTESAGDYGNVPTGPGKQLIPFPQGTTMVDVSDIYDWYKLGMVISDLDDADPKKFNQGAPHTILAFGSEEEEHKMLPLLKRLGLGLHDIDKPEDIQKAFRASDALKGIEENLANEQAMPNINVQQVELANKYYNALVQRAKEDGKTLDTRTLNFLRAKAQDTAAQKTQQTQQSQQSQKSNSFPSQGSERKVAKDFDQFENFADGRNPQNKGDSKRYNVPTKGSISNLRKIAKQGGRKGQLAHWMANMRSGKAKKNK